MKTTGKTYLIADTHFGDESIRVFENRPFDSVDEMNKEMMDYWNKTVTKNDTVYMLGDFAYSSAFDFLFQEGKCVLNGKIILIAGNHDTDYLEFYRKQGIEVIDYPIVLDGFWIMSHEPMYVNEASPFANIFGHVHGNPMYKTVSSRSYCVSAERIGYTPIEFSLVKQAVQSYKE